ncbi:MAG: Na+/H+ antiporter subunit E [Caulobacteraceae bacterium]
MLHAAALLCGSIIVWMLYSQRWSSPQDWAIAAGVGLFCVVVALRFGSVSGAFLRAPRLLLASVARSGAIMRGAITTIGRAVSADVTLNPALVRVKTRAARGSERASFAHMLTATPGIAVVETDADGLLVHVMDEDRIDAAELGRLEQSVGGGAL